MNSLLYIFPEMKNFRELRPVINWEHMYGWIDGYGMLFDPVVFDLTGVIPEWRCGLPEKHEAWDFVVTSCRQASALFKKIDQPGLYIRPQHKGARNRISEKELLITPLGKLYYPSALPFDVYNHGSREWIIADSPAMIRRNDSTFVAFELFSMVWRQNGDWPEKRLLNGANLLRELMAPSGGEAPCFNAELEAARLDFQAYGITRLLLQWLLDLKQIDRAVVREADVFLLEAFAAWHNASVPEIRKSLKKAFSRLYKIRKACIDTDLNFIEYPHMGLLLEEKGFFELEWPQNARQIISSYIEKVEKYNYRLGFEGSASCWENLFARYPSLGKQVKKTWDEGKVDLSNGTYSLPYALMSPLLMQYWQFEHGNRQFRKLFGKSPKIYQCQENSFAPQMPELLNYFGYKGAVHITQNHGSTPEMPCEHIRWASPSGTCIPGLTSRSSELFKKGVNFFLDIPLIMLKHQDRKEVNYYNFQDLDYIPFRAQMIRANRFAPVFGRFCHVAESFDGFPSEAPKKNFSADDYKFSASYFYPNYTNADAFSHFECIFDIFAGTRQLQLLSCGAINHRIADQIATNLCLLEAHDASFVQDQRRGEFYASKTSSASPYSRDTLKDEVIKIKNHTHELLKTESARLLAQSSKTLLNASEVPMSFAKVRHPEQFSGKGLTALSGRYYAVGSFSPFSAATPELLPQWTDAQLPLSAGKWQIELKDDRILVTLGQRAVTFLPLDHKKGFFKQTSSKVKHAGTLHCVEVGYELEGVNFLETIKAELIFAENSDYLEINLRYAPRNNFDPVNKWDDYLALEFECDSNINNVLRFNPNVMMTTAENKICSPYCLSAESTTGSLSLLNQGASLYVRQPERNKLRWLFHVSCETEFHRSLAISFDTPNPFTLSRAWAQGLVPGAGNQLKMFAGCQGLSIESFVANQQLLVSNLNNSQCEFIVNDNIEAISLNGQKISRHMQPQQTAILLKPFELALATMPLADK